MCVRNHPESDMFERPNGARVCQSCSTYAYINDPTVSPAVRRKRARRLAKQAQARKAKRDGAQQ